MDFMSSRTFFQLYSVDFLQSSEHTRSRILQTGVKKLTQYNIVNIKKKIVVDTQKITDI